MPRKYNRMLTAMGYDVEPPGIDDEVTVAECEVCHHEIKAGEEFYYIYGTEICEECIRKFLITREE